MVLGWTAYEIVKLPFTFPGRNRRFQ
jgi:hypothetical protein